MGVGLWVVVNVGLFLFVVDVRVEVLYVYFCCYVILIWIFDYWCDWMCIGLFVDEVGFMCL